MKSAKFYCVSALTALLLMGAGGAVMANDSGAEDNSRVSRVNPVQGEEVPIDVDDVDIGQDGLIHDFTNVNKARKLLAGGHLVIPSAINDITVRGIDYHGGDGIFDYDHLTDLVKQTGEDRPQGKNTARQNKDSTQPGISAVTFNDPDNIQTINHYAFYKNGISTINLPKVVTIGQGAFTNNQITELNLPVVKTIGSQAFINNKLDSLDLPKIENIHNQAFALNHLSEISLGNSQDNPAITIESDVFLGQNVSFDSNGNLQLKNSALKANVPHQEPLTWETIAQSIKPSFKINGTEQIKPADTTMFQLGTDEQFNTEVENDKGKKEFTNIPEATNPLNKFGVGIFYELPDGVDPESALSQNINHNSDESASTKIGNYSTGAMVTIVDPTTPPKPGPDPETEKQPDTNSSSADSTNNNSGNTINMNPVPDLDFPHQSESADKVTTKHPHTIYNKKTIRVHKNKELTSPLKTYRKVARHKAKTFKVLGVAYSKNGVKRYKVAGGYVTAHKDYVANLYYQSTPKSKKIKVIATKGLHKYKDAKLTKKAAKSHVSRNKLLKVTKIVTHGNLTRYHLADGTYVSGNKKLVLQQ